jgi:hypothetical protein
MPNPQGNKFRVNLWLEYARVFHLAAYHEHDSCTKTRLAANQELGTGHVTFRPCPYSATLHVWKLDKPPQNLLGTSISVPREATEEFEPSLKSVVASIIVEG